MRILFFLLITLFLLNATEEVNDENRSEKVEVEVEKKRVATPPIEESYTIKILKSQIEIFEKKLSDVEQRLQKNIWLISYNNYLQFQRLTGGLSLIENEINRLKKRKRKKRRDRERINDLTQRKTTLEKQLLYLNEYKINPFDKLIKPEEIEEAPKITNPILIINAFSYIKHLKKAKSSYNRKLKELEDTLQLLKENFSILKELKIFKSMLLNFHKKYNINLSNEEIADYSDKIVDNKISSINEAMEEFDRTIYITKSTYEVYSKTIDESIIKSQKEIERQIKNIVDNLEIIAVFILISFILKFLAKKYIEDDEKVYKIHKFINFFNVSVIIIILLFAYIDNMKYIVTVIGFASAGLAIAMKDWFMSVIGWFTIIFGGSFHVGDRIKVKKDGLVYVGDIVDISLLNMVIFEDVTLTTYLHNRRAGRMIFVPNHYIFTSLIANYSHSSLKTVWDGIDITITFESNYKKAMHLAKDIVKKYSKGYTDISRRQLNKLRNKYSIKNANVEPKILSLIEENGIRISCWYMTNAFATLTLRSSISADILDAFNKEKDITIAYPTQTININSIQPEY